MISRRILLISIAAISFRGLVALWQAFHPFPFNETIQNYQDFQGYYLWQLAQLAHGYLPYRDFAYSYPPLFLYLLYPFYLVSAQLAAVPIVLADAISAPLIYLIVRKYATERMSLVVSFAYVILPTSLIYEGISWLSEQPMLFFLLLSVYLLQEDRPKYSAVVYGLAILLKQDALFFLPAYVFWLVRLQGARASLKSLSLTLLVLLGVSAPFLVIAPVAYLGSVTLGILQGILHAHLPPIVPLGGGGTTLTGLSFTSTNATLPQLTCSDVVNNVFEISRFCTGVEIGGQTLTNWILIPASAGVRNALIAFALILLAATVPGLLLMPKRVSFQLSLAMSYTAFIIPLLLFSDLSSYKYYLVPIFALVLLSSLDLVSLGIALAIPTLAIFGEYGYLTILSPLIEIQLLIIYFRLRKFNLPVPQDAETKQASF